jgi:3'(2'), 5'-bisphosphate nucleotidase
MTKTKPLDIARILNGAPEDVDALISDLRVLSLEAGAAILKVVAGGFSASTDKADGSPVTEADHAAERVILAGLRSLDDGITVVSEEAFSAGYKPEAEELFWLVDPLDGTREFVSGSGEYTVNIALIRNRRPVLGVIHAPALGMTAWAAVGRGAFESNVQGKVTPLRVRTVPRDGAVVISSRRHGDPEKLKSFLNGRPVAEWRSIGSSLKFVEVAAGRADVYPRFGNTMEWDTAAGDAILTAAGGATLTLDNTALMYGKPGYRNPEFIATADRRR